jgi:lambda family phage portal protein
VSAVTDALAEVRAAMRPNWLDRAIGTIAPSYGLQRMQARARLNMATGGYDAGRNADDGLRTLRTPRGDADAVFTPDADLLRRRAQQAGRNNPIAIGAKRSTVISVVGTGIQCEPQIDASYLGLTEEQAAAWEKDAARLFALVAGDARFDANGCSDFIAQQGQVMVALMEAGDILAVRRWQPTHGRVAATCVELIEAARITNPYDQPDTATMINGVELDRPGGESIAYHVRSVHPGSYRQGDATEWTWSRVPIYGAGTGTRQAVLCYQAERPSQRRGVPRLAGVLKALHQLGEYSDAELKAAVVSAFFTVFVKTQGGDDLPAGINPESPELAQSRELGSEKLELGPAMVQALAENESIEIANPSRPNANYAPFYDAILMQIGAALHLPKSLLQLHFSASYSASKAELLEAWRSFLTDRQWIARTYCQPVWGWFVQEFVARGWLDAPGFFEDPLARAAWTGLRFIGPAQGAINEMDAVQAAVLRIDNRLTSRGDESAAMTGQTWEPRVPQMKREDDLILPRLVPAGAMVTDAATPDNSPTDAVVPV